MVQVERSAGSQELHIRQANNMFIYYLGSGQGHSVAVTCSIAGTFCVRRCFYDCAGVLSHFSSKSCTVIMSQVFFDSPLVSVFIQPS